MPSKKIKQKLIKHRISVIARITACASFLVLAIIGVSSLARAMTLESIEHQNGIPSSWQVASLGTPDSITVPITYWDQRQDKCTDENRQFEWTICQFWTAGAIQGVVKDTLGADGLPVPTYTNSTEAWAANHDVFTANVTGHDPVRPTDNFYRWFHNTSVSQQFNREITFNRVGNTNTYTYGGHNIFPLDQVDFSNGDTASEPGHSDDGQNHNFHFTAHLNIPIKITANGTEKFEFSGDDDVWVFLNGKLVLDIGGLHEALNGSFTINSDGTVTSYVQHVNDVSDREKLGKPGAWAYNYVKELNEHNRNTYSDQTKTINIGLQPGDVVNLDFFYAERSTTASNTQITISNMEWPISADSNVEGKIEGKIENTESNLVEYTTNIKNRDPQYPLDLERMSVYLYDEAKYTGKEGNEETITNSGFIPLSKSTLYYSTSPEDSSSWQPLDISAPTNNTSGFTLATSLRLAPAGQSGDTMYFRYYAETSEYSGNITNRTSYYTSLNGVAGVTYDHTILPYTGKTSASSEDLPKTFNLDIEYIIDHGDEDPDPTIQTPPSVHQELENGSHYQITSPDINGFTPDISIVEGHITDADAKWTVIYTKDTPSEKYKVTIHYIKPDGTKAFPDHISEHDSGETVTVDSPELEGYTRSPESVIVTVEDKNIEEFVYYTPVVIKHNVTIHYVHADGSTAFDDYSEMFAEGEPFSINSPDKSGYTKDIAVVSGTMGTSDRVFTVTYTPHTTPVGPTDPVDPTPDRPTNPDPSPNQPEEGDNLIPSIPVIPGNDDELIYTGPLGETAFVPNTGVVGDFVAPIFEQYFAEVVLSQWFILAVLLIFAGSFSTYFSLRKFINLEPAPATIRPRTKKVMPKSVANSKTARTMQKNAKKATRTNRKVMKK